MMSALLQLSNSILCWSCFSSATLLDFQSPSQGQIHKGILANVHLFMLTIQLYLHLYLFGGFLPVWDLAIVITLPSVANKLQCIVELFLSTLGGRMVFQVTDLLLFPTLFLWGSFLFMYFFYRDVPMMIPTAQHFVWKKDALLWPFLSVLQFVPFISTGGSF